MVLARGSMSCAGPRLTSRFAGHRTPGLCVTFPPAHWLSECLGSALAPCTCPLPSLNSCPPLAGWPEKVSVRAGGPWHRAVPASPAQSRRSPTGVQASRRGDAGSPGPLTHALCLGQPGHMCSHHHRAEKGGAMRPVPRGASRLSVFVGVGSLRVSLRPPNWSGLA